MHSHQITVTCVDTPVHLPAHITCHSHRWVKEGSTCELVGLVAHLGVGFLQQVHQKLLRESFTGVSQQVEHPHSPKHHYTVYAESRHLIFFYRDSPQNMHTNFTQMCIWAQPFSTYHGKICSDRLLFIPTWMPKQVQDLDLRNDADCELLSYGAYVYALGCHLMVNVQWVLRSRPATWRS